MSERRCPVDDTPLDELALAGQLVDRCPACGGSYFDAGELEAAVELVRYCREVALEEEEVETRIPLDRELTCPGCGGDMLRTDLAGVTMDRCDACDSAWLDDGELTAIRVAQLHVEANLELYKRLGS